MLVRLPSVSGLHQRSARSNERLYPFWGSLTEALRTGEPQNEAKHGENFFATLYADEHRLKSFLKGMTGLSHGAAMTIANKFPWDEYRTFTDIGTAEGGLPVQVALAHSHLTGWAIGCAFMPETFQRPSAEIRCSGDGAYTARLES